MKRLGMVIGIGLLASAMPVWAQSTTASARQQADEAAARAREIEANVRARSAEAVRQAGTVHVQVAPVISEYQKALTAGGGYNTQWNTLRTNDPLTSLQVAPGTWWNNAGTATRLNLTKEQQKKMDDIFQQFRLTLIDLNASLSKEELIMDPLIAAEKLDEVKILTQIDRIAQARAELEKANSRMLLGIRQSLTMEQWTKIQSSPGTYRLTTTRR